MNIHLCSLILSCLSTASILPVAAEAISTTVTLDYGTFQGASNTQYLRFQGIKYADSPRFKAPIMPPAGNLGTVNASAFAKACVTGKATSPGTTTTEDCLFANVYVPQGTSTDSALPVVAWFHGGFIDGDTHGQLPDVLFGATKTPFIFVTFEYRVGPFGFLGGAEMEDGGSLNTGLRDQRSALRWLQRYISTWGGNPSQVTIWGQSAGAGSTMFHLTLNGGDSEGLFHRVMGDSPSQSYQPHKDDEYIQTLFNDFASNAGCSVPDPLACLLAAPIDTLMSSSATILANRDPNLFPWAPLVDESFFTETVSSAFNNGRFAQVPVLFGSNTDDGADWAKHVAEPDATIDTVYAFIQAQFAPLSRATFDKAISTVYPLADYNNSLVALTRKMYGEARYICPTLLITGAASAHGISGYNYLYDNPDASGLTKHGAELAGLYTTGATDPSGLFAEMRSHWTSFFTTGSPGDGWQSVDNAGSPRLFLHPGQVSNVALDAAFSARCAFWRSTDEELHR